MKKYEVREVIVETKDGFEAFDEFQNSCNQDTTILKSSNTLEEAKEFYNAIETSCIKRKANGVEYYVHYGKCIEENEYDEDGEWIGGGNWIDYDIPDKIGRAHV